MQQGCFRAPGAPHVPCSSRRSRASSARSSPHRWCSSCCGHREGSVTPWEHTALVETTASKSAGHPQETLLCPTFTQTVFPEFGKLIPENRSQLVPEGALGKALGTFNLGRDQPETWRACSLERLQPGEHRPTFTHLWQSQRSPAALPSLTHQDQHPTPPPWVGTGTAPSLPTLGTHHLHILTAPRATSHPTPSNVSFPLLQGSSWGKIIHCRVD